MSVKHTLTAGGMALAFALVAPGNAWTNERERHHEERGHEHGRRYAGDFHQHTFYTDGSTPFDFVMSKDNEYGLDWWANSEHGGNGVRDARGSFWDDATVYPVSPIVGDTATSSGHKAMWRWQSLRDFVFGDIQKARAAFPERTVVSGLELNVPGHEHCSTTVIARDNQAMSAFEYMFDKSDTDLSREGEVTPWGTLAKHNGSSYSVLNGVKTVTSKPYPDRHLDAVAACRWMQAQYDARTIKNGWMVFAHVERAGKWSATGGGGYNVEHFRDFNNAGPDVCFGFEGAPGHQVEPYRGLGNAVTCANGACTSKDFGGTYGGVGYYSAKVGGLWDALLGEGRHFFNFASSDYHQHYSTGGGDFYPGEYQKDWVRISGHEGHITPSDVADGLRSGDSFFVQGDLVDHLEVTVQQREDRAHLGETLEARAHRPVQVVIEFSSPEVNANGDRPRVDHIDVIAGDITGLVSPSDARYTDPTNSSAQVIASFSAKDFEAGEHGKRRVVLNLKKGLDRSKYFRIRGTNLPCGTPNQVGPATTLPAQDFCSPLPDALEGTTDDLRANAQKAFADLWFYSNPVFVYVD